jgi:hydroxymethylpyrimidine pyrophosphatase-like HAD family hydrolase
MGQTLRKLDILAVAASGRAAEELHAFLQALKEDTATALIGNAESIYHKGVDDKVVVANATDLATSITLANQLKAQANIHLASTGLSGLHLVASAETIAAADATDQATAITLANEIKADYNTHLTESGIHLVNDSTNTVAAADASDLATLQTLLNEIKTDYNAHILGSMASPIVK